MSIPPADGVDRSPEPPTTPAAPPIPPAPSIAASAPDLPPSVPSSYPAAGWPPPPNYPPGYPPVPPGYPATYPPSPPTSSSAIVALVLAIAAWLVCPVIPAVVALVFASRATREIRASGGALRGGELTLAAKLVAWINIGFFLLVLFILGSITLVAVLASMAGSTPTT